MLSGKLFKINHPLLYRNLYKCCVSRQGLKNEKETHFGFQTVTESDKSEKVHKVFSDVATNYDLMNDTLSLGVHRLWKDIFIQRLAPTVNTKLLDVAGGTGDIAFRFVNYLLNSPNLKREELLRSQSHVTVSDINGDMLKVGQKRCADENVPAELVSWHEGDGEQLTFNDNEFTAYTIAFGLRNFTHIDKALSEAYRVLKPGGRFMCLEFSHLNNNLAQWAYDQYSFQLIPVIGQLVAGQFQHYQYLVESIRKFPKQDDLKLMIEEAGFRNVQYENLFMGMVAIHSGFKI